jgi:hypothetical protein
MVGKFLQMCIPLEASASSPAAANSDWSILSIAHPHPWQAQQIQPYCILATLRPPQPASPAGTHGNDYKEAFLSAF